MRDFEWDERKARANLAKHGVTFGESETVFADPLAKVRFDSSHSEAEERRVIVGTSAKVRLLLVSFTDRADRIRIISARPLTRSETKAYEEEI
jgi:uncharacterized protein